MAALRYVVADVFTDKPLTGNQLAVFTRAVRAKACAADEFRRRSV